MWPDDDPAEADRRRIAELKRIAEEAIALVCHLGSWGIHESKLPELHSRGLELREQLERA